MLKKQKNKEKTVAEKIAHTLLHPNESGSDSESEEEATAARVIDYDDDEYELPQAGTTEFRKRNVKLLADQSAKYKGKIASRKDFESSSDEINGDNDEEEEENYENSDSSDDENTLKAFNKALKQNSKTEYEDSDSQEDDINEEAMGEEQSSEDEDDYDMEDEIDSDEHDDDTEVVSEVNHEAEIQKGFSVQNQLRLWERLLELRISLQKILNKTNQLPSPQEINDLNVGNAKHKDIQQATCRQTCQLLQNLLSLQNNLFSQFPELDKAMKPCLKRPFPFKDNNQNETSIKQFSEYLQESFDSFSSYRNSVLLKWDDRTKLLQPGAGNKKRTLTEEYDIIKKIDNALINKTVLKDKSQQLKNSTKDNENEDDVRNPNIYDDSDFYHQQLRELIEYKANTSTSMSEVTKQFVELQKLRQKMKKKVDTRATILCTIS
ncbi:hypothetical protein DOY81_006348 [Sarcophaga bullata]|nr:hypothetical protein DOY81_006348 [Sarcophaga bullata]